MSDFSEWLEEHYAGLVIGGIAVVTLATQMPSIQDGIQRNQSVALVQSGGNS